VTTTTQQKAVHSRFFAMLPPVAAHLRTKQLLRADVTPQEIRDASDEALAARMREKREKRG